jgi:archaellum component FlaC
MVSLTQQLEKLEETAAELMERYRRLQQEYLMLQREYPSMVDTIGKQAEKITELEHQYKTKKDNRTLYKREADHSKTKQVINEMMREIDECLLLLEKASDTE